MSERKIWDAMVEERDNALRAGGAPLAWHVNRSALRELAKDIRVADRYSVKPIVERTFLGIPFKLDEQDREDDWHFSLALKPEDLGARTNEDFKTDFKTAQAGAEGIQ